MWWEVFVRRFSWICSKRLDFINVVNSIMERFISKGHWQLPYGSKLQRSFEVNLTRSISTTFERWPRRSRDAETWLRYNYKYPGGFWVLCLYVCSLSKTISIIVNRHRHLHFKTCDLQSENRTQTQYELLHDLLIIYCLVVELKLLKDSTKIKFKKCAMSLCRNIFIHVDCLFSFSVDCSGWPFAFSLETDFGW